MNPRYLVMIFRVMRLTFELTGRGQEAEPTKSPYPYPRSG